MKSLKPLIRSWQKVEIQTHELFKVRAFLERSLLREISDRRQACGFLGAHPAVQRNWIEFEASYSIIEAAEVLDYLVQHCASVSAFVEAFKEAGESDIHQVFATIRIDPVVSLFRCRDAWKN